MNTQEILDQIMINVGLRTDVMYQGLEIHPSSVGANHFHLKEREDVHFSSHAEQMLLARIRVPAEYVHRCPRDLYFANVSYWLGRNNTKSFLVRYSNWDAGEVRAVFGSRFSPELDDHKVIPIFLQALEGQEVEYPLHALSKDEHLTVLNASFPKMTATYDNREFHAGLVLVNSEVGCSALHIRPAVFNRISRTNVDHVYYSGQYAGRTSFRHNQDLNRDKIVQAIEHASRSAQYGIHRLFQTTTEMVEKPLDALKKLVDDSAVLGENIIDSLHSEYEILDRVSKFKIAQDIMSACEQLPIFKKHQVTTEVGNYLSLFSGDQARVESILDE